MKHLNEYINEELQINEVLGAATILLATLCGAAALHFTVKGLKKIRKVCNSFWEWAIGEKSIGEAKHEEKIDKSKVQPMQIPNDDILEKLMDLLKSDAKKKQGFYVFDNLFKETPELKKMNTNPYYANYVVFMDAGSEENKDERPNFYGMLGFSLKYWKVISKKNNDEQIKEAASKLTKYINIFAVQTDSKYAKQGLFDVYIEDMKKAVKESKMQGLTIKYENDDIAKVFEKSGFKKIEGLDGYMILTLNKPEDIE